MCHNDRHISDETLLNELSSDNKDAFNILFRRFYPMLCAYTKRFVCFADAESIVQDIFLWLWENRKSIIIEHSFAAYLFKMAYRKALNKIKHENVVQKNNNLFYESMKDTLQDEDFYQIEELTRIIKTAINNLPESYRESFVLHRFGDMSYMEIAAKLKVSHKTVDYRIQQALKILRENLKDYLPLLLTFYITQL